MPYASDAQRKRLHAMADRGEVKLMKHKSENEDKKKKESSYIEARRQFIQRFKAAFYKGAGLSEKEFAKTDSARVLCKLASKLKPRVMVKQAVSGRFLGGLLAASVLANPNAAKLFWPGAGGFALGTGAGMYAGHLFRPSTGSLENLRKEEVLAELDKAVEDVQWRIANRKARK